MIDEFVRPSNLGQICTPLDAMHSKIAEPKPPCKTLSSKVIMALYFNSDQVGEASSKGFRNLELTTGLHQNDFRNLRQSQ